MIKDNRMVDIKYLNKDFSSLRETLINFAKSYFADSYKDFNEASPGMMLMDMIAYVGDVLSYYVDSNLKESILLYAEERNNIINLAQTFGWKYKNIYPSTTKVDIYQQIPSKFKSTGTGSASEPDFNYALRINEGMIVQSKSKPSLEFMVTEPVDFSNIYTQDFVATVYQVDANGNPEYYLLKKTANAISGKKEQYSKTFTIPEEFSTMVIPYTDVTEIISVVDSDGNKWYEVEYLAQDAVFVEDYNNQYSYTDLSTDSSASRILKLKRTSNRFVSRKNPQTLYTELHFGSGISAYPDQILIPGPTNIKYSGILSHSNLQEDFLNTRTYGAIPSNTTLTVTFLRGGGVETNIGSNDLTTVKQFTTKNTAADFDDPAESALFADILSSVGCNNSIPASGGKGEDSIEEIRQNAIAYFAAQDRIVTEEDLLARTLSMPERFGSVCKAFVKKTSGNNLSVDIYVLGYNLNKNLTQLGDTTKQNLLTYLSNYRKLTTAINIKNGFIINIGIDFSIITYPDVNKYDVLKRCIESLKDYFNIDNWQIGQCIVIKDLEIMLDKIEGVRTVSYINIYNKYSPIGQTEYSNNYYDIAQATIDNVIYTSADCSIFEVKYPDKDIVGKAK